MAAHITETDHMMSANRITPWHGLGTVVDGAPTSTEAMHLARLDWTVSAAPLFAAHGSDVLDITSHKAAVRSDNAAILGIVGDGYQYVQNADAFGFCDFLAGSGDVRYETAGSLDGGRRVWMLARLDGRIISPVKGDETIPYLLLSNAHDGSASLRAMLTTVRVVCNNTLTMAHRAGSAVNGMDVKIRHSGDINGKVRAARDVMSKAVATVDAYEAAATRLAMTKMSDAAMDAFLAAVLPIDDEAVRTTQASIAQDRIRELAECGAGMDIPGVRGTAWAALNALTEWTTHERGTRSHGGRAVADAKLESVLFGSSSKLGCNGLDWLLANSDNGRVLVPA